MGRRLHCDVRPRADTRELTKRFLTPCPVSSEMRMVVPDHKVPLPIIVLTHAEGGVFQYKKMMDAVEPFRTDLLPRHHAAHHHAQERPVRDDEQCPLRTRRKIFQCFESTLPEIKEILFI